MLKKHYRLVDIGSKIGGSAEKYRRRLSASEFPVSNAAAQHVLTIERSPGYRAALRRLGFDVIIGDIMKILDDGLLPSGDVFMASHILEHLPTLEDSQRLLAAMVQQAKHGVWLKLPSFEQDDTGEGRLKKHNLRFNWTSWSCHRTAFCLEHVREVLRNCNRPHICHELASITLPDNKHYNIVPNLDQKDLGRYNAAEHGPKHYVKFNPPIVGEWDVRIIFN
jgi:hypothetical protein